jgi:hypothetical protein
MSCAIYKLAHGANFLICSKLFAIGKSTTTLVLHEVVVQGAIDGTHIIIFKPFTPFSKDYVYHKTEGI